LSISYSPPGGLAAADMAAVAPVRWIRLRLACAASVSAHHDPRNL